MTKQPQLFWGMIASMWIGNLMLLVINLPLIGLWVRFLKVPYRLMFPSIVLLCCIGIYSINNSPVEVIMTAASACSAMRSSSSASSPRRCCWASCSAG